MNRPPAFQMYAADWLADANVAMSSLEEEGAYIRLICFAWREGWIPADPKRCAALIGKGASEDLARVVQGWFNQSPTDSTKLVHPGLELEREKQRLWREKSAAGGKKSGKSRAKSSVKKGGSKMVEPKTNQKPTLQSSSSSANTTPTPSQVVEAWNAATTLPRALNLSGDRARLLGARLGEKFWVEHFREGIERASKNPFLLGGNDRGWKISFDWFVSSGNLEKIIEGKYDKSKNATNGHSNNPASTRNSGHNAGVSYANRTVRTAPATPENNPGGDSGDV